MRFRRVEFPKSKFWVIHVILWISSIGRRQCHVGFGAASTTPASFRTHFKKYWTTAATGVGQLWLSREMTKSDQSNESFAKTSLFWHLWISLSNSVTSFVLTSLFYSVLRAGNSCQGVWALATAGLHDEEFFRKTKEPVLLSHSYASFQTSGTFWQSLLG